MGIQALGNLALNTIKSTAADKQDVMRINMDILLIRMLTATLWGHVDNGSLQQFEQSLLHTLATHVTRNRRVICLSGYLVYLVDKDDATLGSLDIIVSHLQQTGQNALNILTDIAGLRKNSSVDNGERHVKHLCNGTGQQGLTCSCRTHHNDVRLLNLHAIVVLWLLQTLIVVVDSNGKIALSLVLSNDILVQMFLNLLGFGNALSLEILFDFLRFRTIAISRSNLIGLNSTIFADAAVHTSYQESHLVLRASTEITFLLCHSSLFTFHSSLAKRITSSSAPDQSYHTP